MSARPTAALRTHIFVDDKLFATGELSAERVNGSRVSQLQSHPPSPLTDPSRTRSRARAARPHHCQDWRRGTRDRRACDVRATQRILSRCRRGRLAEGSRRELRGLQCSRLDPFTLDRFPSRKAGLCRQAKRITESGSAGPSRAWEVASARRGPSRKCRKARLRRRARAARPPPTAARVRRRTSKYSLR